MANKGLSVREAAKLAGIHPDTAVRNMHRPHVLELLEEKTAEIRENNAHAAFLRNVELSQTANSEHVRMQANKWIAEVGGITRSERVFGQIEHSATFVNFDYSKGEPESDH